MRCQMDGCERKKPALRATPKTTPRTPCNPSPRGSGSWLPQPLQVSILQSQPRKQLTATTQTDLDVLLARLDRVKRQGYAVSDQETVSGLYVLAAPVLDTDGVPLAGLSIAAPAFQTTLG